MQTRGQQLSTLVVQAAAVGDVDDLEDTEIEEAVAAVQSVRIALALNWAGLGYLAACNYTPCPPNFPQTVVGLYKVRKPACFSMPVNNSSAGQ